MTKTDQTRGLKLNNRQILQTNTGSLPLIRVVFERKIHTCKKTLVRMQFVKNQETPVFYIFSIPLHVLIM